LIFAGVAQLVERQLPKLNVAGSNLVSRSIRGIIYEKMWPDGSYKEVLAQFIEDDTSDAKGKPR
jgi:hypothetical protein